MEKSSGNTFDRKRIDIVNIQGSPINHQENMSNPV